MEVEICERDRTINQTLTAGMPGDGHLQEMLLLALFFLTGLCNNVMFYFKKDADLSTSYIQANLIRLHMNKDAKA